MKGKGKMSDKPFEFKDLAALGADYEKRLNSFIQEMLNGERLINLASVGIKEYVKNLKSIRQFNRKAAQQLNLPTKDDIAAVAKLNMQIEEKLDQIEDLLYKLHEDLQYEKPQEHDSPKRKTLKKASKRGNEKQDTESEKSEEHVSPKRKTIKKAPKRGDVKQDTESEKSEEYVSPKRKTIKKTSKRGNEKQDTESQIIEESAGTDSGELLEADLFTLLIPMNANELLNTLNLIQSRKKRG